MSAARRMLGERARLGILPITEGSDEIRRHHLSGFEL
jgi:hypothetical protein